MQSHKTKTNGFTLIETLVAISIFVASVTALLVVTGNGIKNVNSAQNKLTATYLAQEGAELVRAARDSYFLEQQYYKTVNPLVPEPDMLGITRFCNVKKLNSSAYIFCHGLDTVAYPGTTPWIYKPDWITDHPNADITHIAGPLGPCRRTTGNAVSDAGLAGSIQGCNINFQLQTRVCTEQMHLAQWEDVDSTLGIFGTIPGKRAKFGAEKCAEYFYDQGIFRPSFALSYDANGDIIVDDPDDDITRSGFVRQIFVEPAIASLDPLTDDPSDPFGPKGGLRVTVRVYWIEGHKLLNVRVDDFLTSWPGKIVQGTTTP